MADLFRTVDPTDGDDAEIGAEASGGEEALVLALRKGAGLFADLASEDAEAVLPGRPVGRAAGWDFKVSQEVATSIDIAAAEGEEEDYTAGLEAKIRARLRERRQRGEEAAGEAGEEAEAAPPGARRPPRPARPAETSDHLRTGMHFADLRLSRPLLRAVAELGFESPTPIQRDVIPPALRGLDILATAETGSGKTASFLLPALERLCQSPNVRARRRDARGRIVFMGNVATKVMVLIPTRELAVQCHSMLKDLAKYTMASHQLVVGGFVAHDQANSLRNQPDIVVATPGRLLDHLLNSHSVHMELLEIVVFDEADRLLEMGFKEECSEVLKRCSKGRQTMLFSATLNASVEDLATLALEKPIRVHANGPTKVAETLEQEFVKVASEDNREAVLMSLCLRNYTSNVIIFCASKKAAHRIAILFGLCGLRFAELHGNLQQADRMRALQRFQEQEVDFLIATDLAARGLDLCNVETVINLHLPLDVSRYIHRVGRTARMGRAGRAVTIYCPEEYSKVKALGKQCCSKVKSTVLKRTVAANAVQYWVQKIKGLEQDIQAITQDESVERELRMADVLTNKSDNLQKHRKEINARPAKTWYMTNVEKEKLKSLDLERLRQSEALLETGEVEPEPAQGATEAGKGKKRKRDKGPQLTPEQKRQKRLRQKFLAKREEARAERARDEARARGSARKHKREARPGRLGKGAELRPGTAKRKPVHKKGPPPKKGRR